MVSDTDIEGLVKKIADLERRIAALERRGAGGSTQPGLSCPQCMGAMRLIDEKPHPLMGMLGLKVRTFTCDDCGKAVERDYDPNKD